MMRCRFCGCSDFEPCINLRTGEACAWATDDICSFCCAGNEELAEFVMMARFAHTIAGKLNDFTPEQHADAARLYQSVCLEASA